MTKWRVLAAISKCQVVNYTNSGRWLQAFARWQVALLRAKPLGLEGRGDSLEVFLALGRLGAPASRNADWHLQVLDYIQLVGL